MSPSFLDALRLRDQLRGQDIVPGQNDCMRRFMRRLIEAEK